MKQHGPRQNIYTNEPSKVLDLIREVCCTKMSPKNCESFVSHVIKEEEKLRKTDHIVDNEIETVIIKYWYSSKSDRDSDLEQ